MDWDRQQFSWLIIEDDGGRRWPYSKKRPAQPDAVIEIEYDGKTFRLVLGPDAKALLQQSASGLPPTTIVRLPETQSQGPMAPATWRQGGGVHDFERQP